MIGIGNLCIPTQVVSDGRSARSWLHSDENKVYGLPDNIESVKSNELVSRRRWTTTPQHASDI